MRVATFITYIYVYIYYIELNNIYITMIKQLFQTSFINAVRSKARLSIKGKPEPSTTVNERSALQQENKSVRNHQMQTKSYKFPSTLV